MMSVKNKNVLAFNKDDKFYYQRAMRLIDNMEYIRGIKMLKAAIALQPDNIEYRMDLCEALSDIGYYAKSIEEVIRIIVKSNEIDPKCYYLLGYNYYELGEYIKALNMFERYLAIMPDGDLSEDVIEFLENIEDFTVSSWNEYSMFPGHLYSTKSDITNIDETRMSDDIEVWAREQNIKALMAYSKKEYDESVKICRNILSKLPRQNAVLCTLALSLYKTHEKKESIEIAENLALNAANDEEELFRVCYVLCELELDSYARDILKKLKVLMPYMEKINHYLAISNYNCKDYESARRLWNSCIQVDGDSYQYGWYIDKANNPDGDRLEYTDYLPDEAIDENIEYLEDVIAKKESGEETDLWKDEKFKKIVIGTLERCTHETQKKLLHIIFDSADEEREAIFRTFLLNNSVGEKNKNEILSFLHHMNAKEPFLMMTDYQLVDVAINVISVDNNSKNDFVKVLNYAVDNICIDKKEKEMVVALWSAVAIKFMIANRRVKKTELWAAGFYYVAMQEKYEETELIKKAKEHGISRKSLKDVVKRIIEKKGEKHDY